MEAIVVPTPIGAIPLVYVVYVSRGTLPQKRNGTRALPGDLFSLFHPPPAIFWGRRIPRRRELLGEASHRHDRGAHAFQHLRFSCKKFSRGRGVCGGVWGAQGDSPRSPNNSPSIWFFEHISNSEFDSLLNPAAENDKIFFSNGSLVRRGSGGHKGIHHHAHLRSSGWAEKVPKQLLRK